MKKAIGFLRFSVGMIVFAFGIVIGVAVSVLGENSLVTAAGITQGTADILYVSVAGDTVTGPILYADGTSSDPSMAFASETGTGFHLAKVGRIGIAIDGTGLVMTVDAATLDHDGALDIGTSGTFGTDLTVNGNTILGNANGDGLSIWPQQILFLSTNDTDLNFATDVKVSGASLWRFDSPEVQFGNGVDVEGIAGIMLSPGAGVDAKLLEMQITGTPALQWVNATTSFEFTKTLEVPGLGVGVVPGATAAFQVSSTTKGSIPSPPMTSAQRDAIAGGSPPESLTVYDTTNNVWNFYNGTSWRAVLHVAASSLVTGCVPFADSANSLTDDAGLAWDNTGKILAAKNVTLDGRLQGDKGNDIASADEITLGTDGNYFDITIDEATINHITKTGWQAGSIVVLQFDGSVTVTHNAGSPAGTEASILLAGAGDFSATADDTLQLVYDGTTFREVSRTVI